MALIRWQPFQEVNELQREMNRFFDTLMPKNLADNGEKGSWNFVPAAELVDTPEAVHIKLEVPGIDPNDIDIEVTAESVSIRGERKSESKTEEKGVTRTEFRYGQFHRVIPLPVRINNTNAKADYKDGILTLDLPKIEEEQNRSVKLSIGQQSA
ncbi:MAG: Hsp20/alpha crystallin family protein [Snowella sp.]|nr:Hsp20/alpha crystallin family protein [Snowella sp.]